MDGSSDNLPELSSHFNYYFMCMSLLSLSVHTLSNFLYLILFIYVLDMITYPSLKGKKNII